MISYLNDGDSVMQILACEQDPRRLFDAISKHVAADRAKHAAVYEARVVVEAPNNGSHAQQDSPTRLPTKIPSVYLGRRDLTLTLLHMDTTFRFNGACLKNSSPGLAWPTIHQSFATNTFVDDDLILRAQYHHPDASPKPGQRRVMASPSSSLLTSPRCCSWSPSPAYRDSHQHPRRRHLTRDGEIVQGHTRFRKTSDSVPSVLMQEFDPQQSAETIKTQLNDVSLGGVLDSHQAGVSIRLFSLMGMSSQSLKIPMDPADLPIQNCLYTRSVNENARPEAYFGLSEESFVQI